jgi:Replication initiation factor
MSRTRGAVATSSATSAGCRSSGRTTGPDGGVIPDGSAVYIGSSKSEAMLRVYDKAAESSSPDAGIRWELQLPCGHAVRFVAGAVAAGDGLGTYVLGCILDLVDFRDQCGQERGDRAPLLGWWAAIVADATRVALSGPAKVDSLEKRGVWLARQVAPSLALVRRAYGDGWLNALLRSGEERIPRPTGGFWAPGARLLRDAETLRAPRRHGRGGPRRGRRRPRGPARCDSAPRAGTAASIGQVRPEECRRGPVSLARAVALRPEDLAGKTRAGYVRESTRGQADRYGPEI